MSQPIHSSPYHSLYSGAIHHDTENITVSPGCSWCHGCKSVGTLFLCMHCPAISCTIHFSNLQHYNNTKNNPRQEFYLLRGTWQLCCQTLRIWGILCGSKHHSACLLNNWDHTKKKCIKLSLVSRTSVWHFPSPPPHNVYHFPTHVQGPCMALF